MAQVRIRMYRQGIGDCFLLTFPNKRSSFHMLIDCGVLRGTRNATEWMKRVAANIRETTGGRVDVLVVTHEHWDHISGFLEAADVFKEIKFREVWLAWTEDPYHEGAQKMRQRKEKARRALERAHQRLQLSISPVAKERLAAINALSSFMDAFGAAGNKTTAAAMKWVKEKAGSKVRYFKPGGKPVTFGDIRIYVLGPPEDETLLKKSNPSTRAPEVYQLSSSMDIGFADALSDQDGYRPFDMSFQIPQDNAKRDTFFSKRYYSDDTWRQIEDDWLGTSERLALQMDSHTNNTSLVLAIELGEEGKVLLFPGDAQVGNWLSWQSLSWNVPNARGKATKVTVPGLLARTVFYKVGHHASHNATLREKGLERMTNRDLVAMIPVEEGRAKSLDWAMPFPSLLQRLEEKTRGRVIRADRNIEGANRGKARRNIRYTKDFVDYMVDIG